MMTYTLKYLKNMQDLEQTILIPVLLGIAANHFGGKSMEKISSVLPLISSVAIVTLIAGIMAANSEKILTSGFSVLIIVVLHNLSRGTAWWH